MHTITGASPLFPSPRAGSKAGTLVSVGIAADAPGKSGREGKGEKGKENEQERKVSKVS